MGKGGGGGGAPPPTQQTVTQTNLPEYAQPYFENILGRAQAESYRPYVAYQGERIAGFTPGQTQAQTEALGMRTPGQFGAANIIGATGLGAAFMDPTQMMSPYMQGVVDIQKREAITDAQKAQLAQNLGAARQGTYGGARQVLAATERERQLGQRLADIQASGMQRAYEAAAQRGAQLGQLGIEGARAFGQLGQTQQQSDLQRLQAQAAAGAEQRQFEQQRMDLAYADFLRQRDYPMEQLGYYSNILRGIPVGLGSTATTYAQPPSLASQAAGLGLAGLGIYNLARGG